MNQVEQDKMLREFFNGFSEQLGRHVEKLSSAETISTTQKLLKEQLCKSVWDALIGPDQGKKIAYLTANTIVFVLSYLLKNGDLRVEGEPQEFIDHFLSDYSPLTDTETLKRITIIEEVSMMRSHELLGDALRRINPDIWDKLKKSRLENRFLFWKQLIPGGFTEDLCKECGLILIPSTGTYQQYMRALYRELQNNFRYPDIFLIDTINLPEFKEKGVCDSIKRHIDQEDEGMLESLDEHLIKLGIGLDNKLDAIPITRNFHLPGYHQELKKELRDKILEENGVFPTYFETLVSYQKSKKFPNGDSIVKHIINTWTEEKQESKNFFPDPDKPDFIITMGKDNLFIPMQAALGAHVVYSLFAYLSGGRKNYREKSFIHATYRDKNKDQILIELWKPENLYDQLYDMLRCIFLYVPAISLCSDHNLSMWLRDLERDSWFDPCLPIEADCFMADSSIIFAPQPLKGRGNQPMSCLGGYCLSLNKKCRAKGKAIKSMIEIAKNNFDNKINEGGKRGELNCLIKYNTNTVINKELYFELPKYISLRPMFSGWRIIEDVISNIIRLHFAAVIIMRAIIVTNSTDKGIYWKTEDFIKNLKDDTIGDYFKKIKNQIKTWVENHYAEEAKAFEETNYISNWVDANYDSLYTDRITIKGLLLASFQNFALDDYKYNGYEQALQFLAKSLSENLIEKIRSICLSSGWCVKDHDS